MYLWQEINWTTEEGNCRVVGDTPCIMPFGNKDNYLLMGIFSGFSATSGHHIQAISSSTISDFEFNSARISFDVAGGNGATGFCRMCIPRVLMNETYRVFMNGTKVSYSLLSISNSTNSYLYFTYDHSTRKVIIIPEFPSFLILPLFMIATLLAVIIYRRKHTM